MNALEFSKKTFSQLDLPNLLINIWDYAFCHCSICSQYQKWCTQVAKEKWQPDFVDFGYVITNIKRQNKSFIILEFSISISSADRNKIYVIIGKYRTL